MARGIDHSKDNIHQRIPAGSASSDSGKIGDNHPFTPRIRRYANDVVNGDQWPFEVELSNVTFETRTRSKRQQGVCELKNDGITVGISEYFARSASWSDVKRIIRHELIHVWQLQHRNRDSVTLPTGVRIDDIEFGHNDQSWRAWSLILKINQSPSAIEQPLEEYQYTYRCHSCGTIRGKHRLCRSVRDAAKGNLECSNCGEPVQLVRPNDPSIAFDIAETMSAWTDLDETIRRFANGDESIGTQLW